MKQSIEIIDVGPRDGLQNEKVPFDTQDKLRLINDLMDAGIRRLEVASFVNPKRVPQMADGEAVIAALPKRDDVTYIGLVLNVRGAERALATDIDELGCVVVVTETFAQKNQGTSVQQAIDVANDIAALCKADGRRHQVTLSAAFGCPFEGEVDPQRVIDAAKACAERDPVEIAIADTIGAGVPTQVTDLVGRLKEEIPHIPLRCHFHNTRNTGLANAVAAVQAGVSRVDASVGGMGGCPFAPRATGNIPTDDLVFMLERMGYETGVTLDKLIATSTWLTEKLQRPVPSMVAHAGGFPKAA